MRSKRTRFQVFFEKVHCQHLARNSRVFFVSEPFHRIKKLSWCALGALVRRAISNTSFHF